MSHDLASLMKMDVSALAELGLKYDAPMSPDMSKKELAREVYRAYGAHAAAEMSFLMEEENVWVDSKGVEQTYLSGQSFMQMDGVNKLMPHEVATELMAHSSAASTFAYAYKNPDQQQFNEVLVSLRQAGVNPDEVYNQLSSEYRASTYNPMPREIRTLRTMFNGYTTGNNLGLDPLGYMHELFSGSSSELEKEFTTPEIYNYNKELNQDVKVGGGLLLDKALEKVAATYVNQSSYQSEDEYKSDVSKVSAHLQVNLGANIQDVATQIAVTSSAGNTPTAYYSDLLPQSIDDKRLSGISHPKMPSRDELFSNSAEMRGVAGVYGYGKSSNVIRGVTGLGIPPKPNEYSNNINEIVIAHGDEADYMSEGGFDAESAVTAELRKQEEKSDLLFAQPKSIVPPKRIKSAKYVPPNEDTYSWTERIGWRSPNRAQSNTSQPEDVSPFVGPANPIQMHHFEQNSPEWHSFRGDYLTASLIGSVLGHDKYKSYASAAFDKLGVGGDGMEDIYSEHIERGHRLEPIARGLYEKKYGVKVNEVGAVTNARYAGLAVSPDGLVGDDGLVEIKAPTKAFNLTKQHPYYDQVQMQMAVTDRKWTDLVQITEEGIGKYATPKISKITRVKRDDKWIESNKETIENFQHLMHYGKALKEDLSAEKISKEEMEEMFTNAVANGNVKSFNEIKEKESSSGLGDGLGGLASKVGGTFGSILGMAGGAGIALAGAGGAGVDALLNAASSGSLSGAGRTLTSAMGMLPGPGKWIAAAIGGASILSEGVDIMKDEIGFGVEAGITNPFVFTDSKQNFEALGLNEHQAVKASSSLGTMTAEFAFGDSRAAGKFVTDFRGLVSLDEVLGAKDPSQLTHLLVNRAKARGWTQQQFAGAASVAGMPELSRAWTANAETWGDVDKRSGEGAAHTKSQIDKTYDVNSTISNYQARLNPAYNLKGEVENLASDGSLDKTATILHMGLDGITSGKDNPLGLDPAEHAWMDPSKDPAWQIAVRDKVNGWFHSNPANDYKAIDVPRALYALEGVESSHGLNLNNPNSTASGRYQVLAGTLNNPSFNGYDKRFNIDGVHNSSEAEKDRVAKEYLQANIEDEGDLPSGVMAYHIGPNAMHKLKGRYGDAWVDHLSAEQSKYLSKFNKSYNSDQLFHPPTLNQYELSRQSKTQPQKIDVSVDIKGNTASATVRHNSKVVSRKDVRLTSSAAVVNS